MARSLLRALLQAPAVLMAGALAFWFLRVYSARVGYPFDLEWMEGGMLVHVWRIREGLGLYVDPSAEFVPYIYPPLYPWFLGLFGEPSYAVGRTVSMLGTFAAAAAAVYAVRKEGAAWGIAVAAGGLFLSCYEESGTFYDIVRADAMAIGLAAWAIALCRRATTPTLVAGGLILALAYLTKHNHALYGVPIVIWLWRAHGLRPAMIFTAASAGPALLATGVIEVASGFNFLTYLVGVPGSHPLNAERAWPLSEQELATCLMWTNAAAFALGLAFVRRINQGAAYWLGILAAAIGSSILMRAHHGGFVNVLMPGHWALAVCGAGMLGAAVQRWQHPVVLALASALLTWQLWDGRWDPQKELNWIPSAEEAAAGERLVAELSELEGTLWAPQFAWLPAQAGKEPSIPLISLWDIDHKRGPFKEEAGDFTASMREHRWDWILVADKHIRYGIEDYYVKDHRTGLKGKELLTRTGWRVRPGWLWRPKEDIAAEEAGAEAPEVIPEEAEAGAEAPEVIPEEAEAGAEE
ncbi:MAG: hypothetical protein H6741_32585 [Alphaproteobacteria bacterium]|nr:hypothetical protein [Alphaproteobacteria bacterium]MCB9797453.1 hypothetical protein [Alphaproteobacteria bacterium]